MVWNLVSHYENGLSFIVYASVYGQMQKSHFFITKYSKSWNIWDKWFAKYCNFPGIWTLYLMRIFTVPSMLMDGPNHLIYHSDNLSCFPWHIRYSTFITT